MPERGITTVSILMTMASGNISQNQYGLTATISADLNNGKDVVERANQSGYMTVRFSDIRNDDFCIVDTLIPIAPHSIISKE